MGADPKDAASGAGTPQGRAAEPGRPAPPIPPWVARVLETISDSLFVLDRDWRFVHLNRQALLDAREGPEGLLGRSLWEKYPQLLGTPLEAHYRRAMAEQTAVHFEMQGLLSGRWLEVHAYPSPEGLVAFSRDATARRLLEGELRQAQKMEAVGRLAGGVAHDFNNVLTVIQGYGALLVGRLDPADPAEAMAREVLKAAERAAALTQQLLAFSRQSVLAPRVLDLNAVVLDLEKMLRRVIGEDIDLATDLQPGLGRVRADPGQIEQVLMNLAVNARDAMPRGGKLTIGTRDVDVDGEYARLHAGVRPGPYVLLAVSDNGCGMTPEVRARAFEPFFTTKEVGKGTGLGLATVHGIVQQSGGHVEVYSEPGVGTLFKVYLPRVEEAASAAKSRSGVSAAPKGTETILLVEDEDAVRRLSRYILHGAGYRVLEACDGAGALAVAGRHEGPIHLLVSDVVMPGLGGRQLAERLHASRPATKVLFVSGYTHDAVVRHGVLQETVHFLQKPYVPLALTLKVREVLDAP